MPEPTPKDTTPIVYKMIQGIEHAQLVYVAAKLGIADLLASGPKSGEELARSTGMHAGSLTRVLRYLAAEGVFSEGQDGRFGLNAQAAVLRSGVPGSVRGVAAMLGEDWYWRAFGHLLDAVRTGRDAFQPLFGAHAYDYLEQHPEAGQVFAAYMNDVSELLLPMITTAYDFSRFRTIVDVGGGRASLVLALLKARPELRGVVLDSARTLEGTRRHVAAAGLADRCELVAGSFFEQVPRGGDAYLLRNVLHDWDDDHVLKILAGCRAAMDPGATLLISEAILPEGPASRAVTYADIQVMVTLGGRQRTGGEMKRLLEASGLELVAIKPTGPLLSMVEARPLHRAGADEKPGSAPGGGKAGALPGRATASHPQERTTAAVEIEYVTHAALWLRSPRVSLLTDPFFFPELDPITAPFVRNFPPRDIDPAMFGRLDFVFSSHEHHDHCHPHTLARLKEQIGTVLLPAEHPSLAARYREVGFDGIRFLANRTPVDLGNGLRVTCFWDDALDTTLLIELDGIRVLHGNDCRLKDDSYREIAAGGRVDYAFLCSTSTQQLFPLLLPRPPEQLDWLSGKREEAFFEAQLVAIDALRPRVVLPYSYTATFVEPHQIHLNCYSRLTPSLFRRHLAARRPDVDCWSLQPGDVIDTATHKVRRFRPDDLWGDDLPTFRRNLTTYAQDLQERLPAFDHGDPDACEPALLRHLEQRLGEGVPLAEVFAHLDHQVSLEVLGRQGSTPYLIDVRRKSVERRRPATPAKLQIAIPASLLASMLAGAYDAFMILYTYRIAFRMWPGAVLSPDLEYALYMCAFLALFLAREDPLLADWASLVRGLAAA